ncbi:Uncharacterised protein [Mycobacteroides abscessus subsp. abscessus]|nr:Uncharacterised protein [Mycobacteroides abscessus subsp. abscessus]
MRDHEPRGHTVGRHQQLHPGLDVFVLEALSGDVEEVVTAGFVEVETHIDHVVECLRGQR